MSTAKKIQPASPEPAAESIHCRTAQFTTRWLQPDTVVIGVHGEIDAANSQEFIDYALRHAGQVQQLILDLSGTEFFGTAGFSALHTVNVRCVGAHIEWALTPSAGVARILRICDPDRALPMQESVAEALSAVQDRSVQDRSQPLLQLVPKSR